MAGITLKEIAEKANVSIGTVDRVLHNRGGVNELTAEKIKTICQNYGYEGNIVGKAMALQRKESNVAVVINSESRSKFSSVVHEGIKCFAKEVEDYNVKFKFFDLMEHSVSEICKILDELYEQDFDALIIKPLDSTIIKYKLQKLKKDKGLVIVNCSSELSGCGSICYVGQNHKKLGRMMASVLCHIQVDPIKILIVVGPLSNPSRKEKLEGFIEYLQEQERDYDILSICEVPFDVEESSEIISDLLPRYPEANAFYMHSPEISVCIEALEKYQNFKGKKFCFAHEGYIAEKIKNKFIDFAIYEDPFSQGYNSAKVVFNYLLNEEIPANRELILDGKIVFDENC